MKGVTPYQLEMLQAVGGAPEGAPIDFDSLLEKLSWKPKKESAQFTIRACITKGLMVKTDLQLRRGRLRVCYELTEDGKRVLDPRPSVSADRSEMTEEVVPGGLWEGSETVSED